MVLCQTTNVDWSRSIEFVYSQEESIQFEKVQNLWWKAAMFDHENEEEFLVLHEHIKLIRTGAEELLKVQTPD